jgi:FecR protein
MSTPSPSRFRSLLVTFAACSIFALPGLADSQARIVRLSDVQGSVQINKNSGLGFENAFVNLPITQGTQLRTGATGRAEIEFEDGSSMRLGPNTNVEFSHLSSDDSGKRTSQINLAEGLAYIDWMGKDEFGLNFSREKILLDHAARFRVDVSPQTAHLAVFKGEVDVDGVPGKLTVQKKKTAIFNVADEDKSTLASNVQAMPLDEWDQQATAYHDQYAKNNQIPVGYGVSDLNYYGSYSNVAGYGQMWQPFFAGVGWDPFMDGAWGWYPGFGYMYASSYPWGWLPYMYGNWSYAPGYGWGWQPGGFKNFHPVPLYTPTTLTRVNLVVPSGQSGKTIIVGKGAMLAASPLSPLTIKAGTAGLGVARGSLADMKSLNHQVAKSGFAEVHPASQFAASSPHFTASSWGSAPTSSAGHASSAAHSSAGGGGGAHH